MIQRRIQQEKMTPAEIAIRDAMWAVEAIPHCDPLLTEAVTLLADARNRVADFVDRDLARADDEARAKRAEDDTREVPLTCKACKGSGRVLMEIPRPGGPPGNQYVECVRCRSTP